MDSVTRQTGHQDNASARASATTATCKMGYWRWLLFAAMARLELREDIHLRIPNAKTTRRVVNIP
jgi:hypothetical protein